MHSYLSLSLSLPLQEWMAKIIAQQKATPVYKETVLLSNEIEEQTKSGLRDSLPPQQAENPPSSKGKEHCY